MSRQKYLYEMDGVISKLYPNGNAEIEFDLDNVRHNAFLKKNFFYHNGKIIPEFMPVSNYVRINTPVKFSCHVLNRRELEVDSNRHNSSYSWFVVMCWIDAENLPHNKVSFLIGIYSASCTVEKVVNRQAVLTFSNTNGIDHRIQINASKFYLHGKRLSSSKMLSSVLNKDDKLICDAVPCIEEENRNQCRWFATCGFQGQRPSLEMPWEKSNYLQVEAQENKLAQLVQQPRIKNCSNSSLINVIKYTINNPRGLFVSGYGYIFDVLNDEFAVMLGCFRLNVFQTILFHRTNAFLFKTHLAKSKLSEVFVEGDYLRFIAVAAPADFLTDWIAVQVSVPDIEDPSAA